MPPSRSPRTTRSRSTTPVTSPSTGSRRGHHLAAAFYRNTIVHYFVGGAIGELALVHAAELRRPADRVDAFWAEAYRLRDLLKFDFFFEQRERSASTLADGAPRAPAGMGGAARSPASSRRAARQDAAAPRVRRAATVHRGVPRGRTGAARRSRR